MFKWIFVIGLFAVSLTSCRNDSPEGRQKEMAITDADLAFDREKWLIKEAGDYPFRDQMLRDVVYNDTIRTLDKDEVIALLGTPDRVNEGHLYYNITRKGIGAWTVHATTMVIKLRDDNSIEWIRIHE